MAKSQMVWVRVKTPVKMNTAEKERVTKIVESEVVKFPKVHDRVSRIVIKAGRVYLYELIEQFPMEGVTYTKPLIDGKYFEFPMARITIFDKGYSDCTLDWQRHNGQWMTLEEGSLVECIEKIDTNEWFQN